jgi:isopenicillin-N epimerase
MTDPALPFGHHMLEHWPLHPAVTYLNHGTVGVTPRRVTAAQRRLQDEMEQQPSRFMLREVSAQVGMPRPDPTRLRAAAGEVAAFVGANPDDLVFVENATAGINAVLRSLHLEPGDDIVLTDHGYGANARTATFIARERGAHVRTVAVPYPGFRAEGLAETLAAALTPRTRLVLIDHITSESGLILPVREIAAVCRRAGVPVLVDGAHAPGVLTLDVPALGVDWYTANLHKWAFAPRSSGFLWAHPSRQADLHPAIISWGLDQGFQAEFGWLGTRDPTPWLAAPAGIDFLKELGTGAMWDYNHALAWRAAVELPDRWDTHLEVDEHSIGFMATIPLPDRLGSTHVDAARLRDALLFEDHIEVQLHAGYGRLWARVSAQVYVEWSDIERFGEVIARRAQGM